MTDDSWRNLAQRVYLKALEIEKRADAAEAEVARLQNLTRLVVRPWFGVCMVCEVRESCRELQARPAPPPEEK